MSAGQDAEADDGILAHADEAAGLAYAAALGDVGEDGDDGRLGQAGIEQGRALALGKTGLAALAIEQPALLRAVVSAHGEVAVPALAVVGTVVILAAEHREVIHDNAGSDPSMRWSGACSCCRKPGFSVQ